MAVKYFKVHKTGLNLNNTKIVNLAAPVNDTDAVNKAFAKNASNITEGILDNSRLNTASTTQAGIVQLNNSTNSTSDTEAATPSAVKAAYDLANTANTTANAAIPSSQKGVANGVAILDENGKVPTGQLPSYVDDVVEYADFASLPTEGEIGKIYLTADNKAWRWTGSSYINFNDSIDLADLAIRLDIARTISANGDVDWNVSFNGSQDVSGVGTLSNSGVDAGTYTKTTVDSKGRVVVGSSLEASDVAAFDASKIVSGKFDNARLNVASTTQAGIVQLNDSVDSTSTTEAATANSLRLSLERLPSDYIPKDGNLLPYNDGYTTSGFNTTNSSDADQLLDTTNLSDQYSHLKTILYTLSIVDTVTNNTQTCKILINKGTSGISGSEFAVVVSNNTYIADFNVVENTDGNIELRVNPSSSNVIRYSFIKTVVLNIPNLILNIISKPVILKPPSGSNMIGSSYFIKSSEFTVTPADLTTHKSTSWQLAYDSAFTNLIADVTDSTEELTELYTAYLDTKTTYYVRAKYKGENDLESEWSDAREFTTKGYYKEDSVFIGESTNNFYGESLTISKNDQLLAVGAFGFNSNRGKVYIYNRVNDGWSLQQSILCPDTGNNWFGYSISFSSDGSRFIVGAPIYNPYQGKIYIFVKSGSGWSLEQGIECPDTGDNRFGHSVSMCNDGDRVVVGAYYYNSRQGKIHIYIRSETTWSLEQSIICPDTGSNDFGSSVSINSLGDRVVVGAGYALSGRGKIFIYSRLETTWNLEQDIICPDTGGNWFGKSVSMNSIGDKLVVGAYYALYGRGKIYIYTKSDTTWILEEDIISPDISSYFGYSVKMNLVGDRIIAGGYVVNSNRGRAYIYYKSDNKWLLYQTLDTPNANEYFGMAVDITNDNILTVIGASRYNSNQGKVYIFKNSDNIRVPIRLDATATTTNSGTFYGYSIALDSNSNRLLISEHGYNTSQGKIYIYVKSGNSWILEQEIVCPDSGINRFGFSVSMNSTGDRIVVGAYNYNSFQGKVYIYVRINNSWTLEHSINGLAASSYFGESVDITDNGDRVVVGASNFNSAIGRVYVYSRSGTTWSLEATIPNPDNTTNRFGYSVSITSDGDRIAIGKLSSLSDNFIYVYSRSGTTWNLEQKILSSDSGNIGFGRRVKLSYSGSRLMVSAISYNSNRGKLYIFSRSGNVWSLEQGIEGPDAGSQFSSSFSFNSAEDKIVVGQYAYNSNQGKIHIYNRIGTIWSLLHSISCVDGTNMYLGETVALISRDSNLVLTTARGYNSFSGKVYIYNTDDYKFFIPCSLIQTEVCPDGTSTREFGYSIAINYNCTRIIVGAPAYNSYQGKVFIYRLVDGVWVLEQSILCPDGSGYRKFGYSVSMTENGDRVIIGAPNWNNNAAQGKIYIYTRTDTTWNLEHTIIGPNGNNTLFGAVVVISSAGNRVVVSATGYSSNQGRVYIYSRSGTTWTLEQIIDTIHTGGEKLFGRSIVINNSEDTIVIGSPHNNSYNGSIYFYTRLGTTWSLKQYFNCPDAGNNRFGISIACNYDCSRLVVGAYIFNGEGKVYFYTKFNNSWVYSNGFKVTDGSVWFGYSLSMDELGNRVVIGGILGYTTTGRIYTLIRSGDAWTLEYIHVGHDPNGQFGFSSCISKDSSKLVASAPYFSSSQGKIYIYSD